MVEPEPSADGSWMVWSVTGIGGIWIAVALISLFAPDMVTGSEQQHVPVAAASAWLWGLIATVAFLRAMSRLRGDAKRGQVWIGLAAVTLVVWLIATILSVTVPVFVTGSDPTRIPLGALITPLAAAGLTVLGGVGADVFAHPPEPERTRIVEPDDRDHSRRTTRHEPDPDD